MYLFVIGYLCIGNVGIVGDLCFDVLFVKGDLGIVGKCGGFCLGFYLFCLLFEDFFEV